LGLPLNEAMLRWTQSKAKRWSRRLRSTISYVDLKGVTLTPSSSPSQEAPLILEIQTHWFDSLP
jgi:hypothetical protein